MGPYPPRVVLAQRTPGGGFYTVRDGIYQGYHRLYTRFVGVEDVWNDS